jgi:putative MATE family efflux protein
MRTVAIAQAGTIFMNIVLAPILIFGWGTGVAFGVAGASLATLISMIVGVGAMLWHVHRKGAHFDHTPGAWKPQFAVWKKLLMIGLPSGVEFGVMAVYFGFILAIIRPFGPSAQAAFGVGMRVLQAGMLPAMAIGFAASAVAGQNYGAKLPARVRESFRSALIASLLTSLMLMIPLHLFPERLMQPFSSDPAVISYGVDFLHMISWNLIATAMIFPCFSVFNGFGNTIPSLIASATRMGFVIIAASWLSTRPDFQIHSVWMLSVAATVVQALMNLWFVRLAFRKYLMPLEAPGSIAVAEPAVG